MKIASPRDAIALGIGMVHQHFVLVDPFTVTENIILGDEGEADPGHGRRRAAGARSSRTPTGSRCEPDAVIEDLSVGEEQRVEILKALYRGVEILILDEPTAVLTPIETQDLFGNLRNLRDAGKTIVFISHKLDEVLQIADRITVLRRGAVVGETTPAETSKAKLAEMMVGRPVLFRLEKPQVEIGEPVLHVEGLEGSGRLHGLSFEVRAGEILGVAGVEGNGQRELAETLIGLRTPDAGDDPARGQTSIAGLVRGGRPQRRRRLHPRGPPRAGAGARHDASGRTPSSGATTTRSSRAASASCSSRRSRSWPRELVKLFDVRTRSIDVDASARCPGGTSRS